MPRFIALTSRGLADALFVELNNLGIGGLEKTSGGVYFDGNWAECYRVNLQSRLATRVLLTILDFVAYNQDDLYNNIKKHDYTKYIDVGQTIAVDASANSQIFRDQRFVALKVKDAIVDQFREKFGERPNVDAANADLTLNVRAYENQISVGLDTSGDPLFRRGYRVKSVEAPLKEHLAAAMIDMTGWDMKVPLVDPMCGSGTILIEAALKKLGVAPGLSHKKFAFQKWKTYQEESWNEEVEKAMAIETPDWVGPHLYGYDIDRKAVIAAQANGKVAQVEEYVHFKRETVELIEPPEGIGIVIANPPYGMRLGDRDELKDVYRNMGFVLKNKFKGWTAWVLSGDAELPSLMGMKASRRIPVYNGPIECRFLKYEIR
jgi:23S rRNA G2445 N2-methylase RlmL